MSKEIKKEDSLNQDQHNQDQQEGQSLDFILNNEEYQKSVAGDDEELLNAFVLSALDRQEELKRQEELPLKRSQEELPLKRSQEELRIERSRKKTLPPSLNTSLLSKSFDRDPSESSLIMSDSDYNHNIHGSSSRDPYPERGESNDASIGGSSSRNLPGSSARDSHSARSELKLNADEQELIDNKILSYHEILKQRFEMSQYQDRRSFQSQSQGLFSQRSNPFAQNSGEGESMAKSGSARGIDHKFIERASALGSLREGFFADGGSFESPEKKHLTAYELIDQIGKQDEDEMTSRSFDILIDESLDFVKNGPPSLIGSEENDHESDLNETEIELLESGVSIQDIIELREQIAKEQIQPLSGQSLSDKARGKSPSQR